MTNSNCTTMAGVKRDFHDTIIMVSWQPILRSSYNINTKRNSISKMEEDIVPIIVGVMFIETWLLLVVWLLSNQLQLDKETLVLWFWAIATPGNKWKHKSTCIQISTHTEMPSSEYPSVHFSASTLFGVLFCCFFHSPADSTVIQFVPSEKKNAAFCFGSMARNGNSVSFVRLITLGDL